jgi:hypothetical protein
MQHFKWDIETEFVNIISIFHVSNDIQAWEPNILAIWSVIRDLCVFSVEPKERYCAWNVRQTIHRRYLCWLPTSTINSPSNKKHSIVGIHATNIYFLLNHLFIQDSLILKMKYASFETSSNNNPVTQHHRRHHHHNQNNNIMETSNIVRKGKNCPTNTKIVVRKPITRSPAKIRE